MTRTLFAAILAGAACFVAALLIAKGGGSNRPPGPSLPSTRERGLEKELERLRARIAELEHERASLPQDAATPKNDNLGSVAPERPEEADPPAASELAGAFQDLSKKGLSGYQSKGFHELADQIAAAGAEGLTVLYGALAKGETSTDRFLAAALLEEIGDPAAIPALSEALRGDADDLVRRMSSHALAVIGTAAAADPLRLGMEQDRDWGVRVNSAYGLAKQGDERALRSMMAYYEDPSIPEYRLAILGGLADVAASSSAPLFRKIVRESRDMSYLLVSIGALEKMKDVASLTDLQALLVSSTTQNVKEAAQKAIDAIRP